MKEYSILFLDVDGTLLDFDKCQQQAYIKTADEFGVVATKQLLIDYDNFNKFHWQQLEKQLESKQQVLLNRHKDTFAKHNINIDAQQFNDKYEVNLSEFSYWLDDAEKLLSDIKQCGRFQIAIVTNGLHLVQTRRLKESGIVNYADYIYISDSVGYNKPDVRLFDYIFADMKLTTRENCLMVGDSLTSDIQGGINYNLDTCWVNYAKLPADRAVTYTIPNIDSLRKIINI